VAPKIRARFSVANTDEVTLFVLGVRVNKFRLPHRWLPVVRALKPMLRELTDDPSLGMLGYRQYRRGLREIVVVQYWKDTKHLLEYSQGATHRTAWTEFYRWASAGSSVGVWHETFVVPAGRYEAIYGFVPEFGLAEFSDLRPILRRNASAAARLGEGDPS
jgi:Domain of unknown function (DUF4188)